MVDNSTDTTTTVAQFTNTAQQQKQDTTTMSTMTEDQGFQNNSPVTTETTPAEVATADPPPTTTATSIAEATTNSPTVPKETAIATTTASEAPLPEPTATTTQAVITTTVEETPVQTHQPPTEVFTTKVDSTMPIATPYVESIYSTPTMIAPGVVSSFSTTSTGFPISNPVNTMAVPSTTTAATTISCISSNQTSHCTTTDLSTNTMSTGQIAGIAVGAIAFVSLLGACLFIVIRKKRNNTDHYRNQSNKQVSPVADDHEKQSNSSLNNSHAVLYQGLSPESSQICSNPEMSESVYGDNLFYSNSADYRRTSSIMNVNNNNGYLPNSKDSQLGVSFIDTQEKNHVPTILISFSLIRPQHHCILILQEDGMIAIHLHQNPRLS
jgi:hypothetical protein